MPPLVYLILIRVASWLVPGRARRPWHDRWATGVRDWWVLVERGELMRGANSLMARTIRVAFADAFWRRCNKAYLQYWVRGPAFLLLSSTCALALAAILTSGYAVTRTLLDLAAGRPPHRILLREGPTGTLIAYTLPIVFALAAGLILAANRRPTLRHHGWRFGGFLVLKTLSVLLLLALLWIEGGTALRGHIHNGPLRVVGGGLAFTLLFIFVFGAVCVWSVDDQRRRCPVCLRRLSMPVTIGFWGSTFEPPVIELLCDDGHGALALFEGQPGQMDRWTAMDESWRELFAQWGRTPVLRGESSPPSTSQSE